MTIPLLAALLAGVLTTLPALAQDFKPKAISEVLAKVASQRKASEYLPPWNPNEYRPDPFFPCDKATVVKRFGGPVGARKLAGLARMLQQMPKSDRNRIKYIEAFDTGVSAARSRQLPNGFWSADLISGDRTRSADATTTALAMYSMAWGVNEGIKMEWLDSGRLPVIRAWRALAQCAGGNGLPPESDAAGAFLFAGAEVCRMAQAMAEPMPFVTSPEYQHDLEVQKKAIAARGPVMRREALAVMRKVCEWQQGHLFQGAPGKTAGDAREPDKSWFRGALMTGVAAAARATEDDYYWELIRKTGEHNHWQPGPNVLHDGNDLAITQSYLACYLKAKQPAMIEPTRAIMNALAERGHAGRREWSWADALFMAPAAWAQMSVATGDPRYLTRMNAMWWDSIEFLYDKQAHLFYRDATYKVREDGFQLTERNGQKVFWGRGNGWVAGGLCSVLEALPKDYPDRPKYEKLLVELCASLAAVQGQDGLWRASLLDPDSYPLGETSSSTFFCYGIAWAINHGVIDRAAYLPAAQKAWKGLMACVEPDGMLGYVQLPADSPRSPTYRSKNVEYAAGAFLLAGSEMIRLLEDR